TRMVRYQSPTTQPQGRPACRDSSHGEAQAGACAVNVPDRCLCDSAAAMPAKIKTIVPPPIAHRRRVTRCCACAGVAFVGVRRLRRLAFRYELSEALIDPVPLDFGGA